MASDAAERLLAKIRQFASELEPDERELLAILLAPGVAQAYAEDADVTGFAVADFAPLPEALAAAVRHAGLRVTGLEGE